MPLPGRPEPRTLEARWIGLCAPSSITRFGGGSQERRRRRRVVRHHGGDAPPLHRHPRPLVGERRATRPLSRIGISSRVITLPAGSVNRRRASNPPSGAAYFSYSIRFRIRWEVHGPPADRHDLSPAATHWTRESPASQCGALCKCDGPGAIRTRDLLLRRQALYPAELRTLPMYFPSGRRDLNPGPPAPEAGALPDCATPRLPCALRESNPQPSDP